MIKSILTAIVLCASCTTVFGVAICLELVNFRGDINASGGVWDGGSGQPTQSISISDPILLSNYLFGGGPEPDSCPGSWDANSDGSVNASDPVFLLNYLFSGGSAPAADTFTCHVWVDQ